MSDVPAADKSPAHCEQLPPGTLTVQQACSKILDNLPTLSAAYPERVPLRQAHGRILAQPIRAAFDVPPYCNASMDGYAFAYSDASYHTGLQVIGHSLAGHPYPGALQPGECVRIMTGAMLPEGADSVVMQENVQLDGETVTFHSSPVQGSYIRQPGEDMNAGTQVLQPGHHLRAADLGLLASLGIYEVAVRRKPRVAIFSTGDELAKPGQPLKPGQIHDSNRYTLMGMLQHLDVDVLDMGVIADQQEAVETAFVQASQQADVLISSGGVSVGEADYVTRTLEKQGEISFWKVAMKPGKPLAHGYIPAKAIQQTDKKCCVFFGLPGNPVSVMATFLLFVRPAILKLRGNPEAALPRHQALTAEHLPKTPGREEYQRGICHQDERGQWHVRNTGSQESHLLRSMSQANCFILLPRDSSDIAMGHEVTIIPFAGLL